MSWFILLPLAVAFLLSLFLLGSRVFVAFLTLNIVGLLVLVGPRGYGLFTNSIYETATSPSLITVALFVLMGEILFRSGSVDLLFNSVDRLVGEVRGRLYIVVMLLFWCLIRVCGGCGCNAWRITFAHDAGSWIRRRAIDRHDLGGSILGTDHSPVVAGNYCWIFGGCVDCRSSSGRYRSRTHVRRLDTCICFDHRQKPARGTSRTQRHRMESSRRDASLSSGGVLGDGAQS